MKQYILLAATALTLAACTNDEMTTATDSKVALKVNASIGTVDTRAVGTQWTTGDLHRGRYGYLLQERVLRMGRQQLHHLAE